MKVGDIINAKVDKIKPTYLLVKLEDEFQGLLHIANISDYYVANIGSMFKIGNSYDFQIIEVDKEKKWVKLSYKAIVARFQKNPFEFKIQETKNGFKNLADWAKEGEEND